MLDELRDIFILEDVSHCCDVVLFLTFFFNGVAMATVIVKHSDI